MKRPKRRFLPENRQGDVGAVALPQRPGSHRRRMAYGLTPEKIISMLADNNFAAAHTDVLAEVYVEKDILPDGVLRLLTEKEATVNNQTWRVHKGDADPFPFDPHAHNVETGVKLDLRDGFTYKKRKYLGSIKRKHPLELREKLEAVGLELHSLTR